MDVEWKLDPNRREPKVIILAGEITPELEELARQLAGLSLAPLTVWHGDRALLIEQRDFLGFYADGRGISAQTVQKEAYAVRLRLYELEERLDRRRFVRISNSEIVNLEHVTALDLSLTGTIRMTLAGGTVCYVSRRYVKKIKEALGL